MSSYFNYPPNPVNGQSYTDPGGTVWYWSAKTTSWNTTPPPSGSGSTPTPAPATPSNAGTSPTSTPEASGNAADVAIKYCLAQIGKPYGWGTPGRPFDGAEHPSYDCSGLVGSGYAAAGIQIGGDTYVQVGAGTDVPQADLIPGDLIFPDPGHVQMYIGNGYICEAQQPGTTITTDKIWGFWKARRIVAGGATGVYVDASGTVNPNATTTTTGTGTLTSITNPFGAVSGLSNLVADIINPALWLRVALVIGGTALVALSIKHLSAASG